MAPPVARWLRDAGLQVKSEFVTPWGICDLVALRFNPKHVTHRLQLKQTKAIGTITRTFLLLQIPEVDSKQWTSVDRLAKRYAPTLSVTDIADDVERLIADRFVVRSERGALRRLNGWMPLQQRLVAVELKLARVEEAMWQAQKNLGFADESYAAFPADVAVRIARRPARWAKFFDQGVGLLAVTPTTTKVLMESRTLASPTAAALQMYCAEKFWRTRLIDN